MGVVRMSEQGQPTARSWRSLIEGGAWVVAAVILLMVSGGFSESLPMFEWGPAFWPRAMLAGIIIAGLALAATAVFPPLSSKRSGDDLDDIPPLASWSERIRVAFIFGVPLLYVFAMHKMGFLLATPIFLIVYMYVFGVRGWKPLLIVGLSVYAVVVLVFVKLIFTPLPQGAGVFYTINGYLLALLQ